MATSSTPLNFIVPDDCTLKVALETASPWKPSIRSDYRVGLRILARYRTNGNFYPCKITAINEGGTYAVQFGEGKESEIQDATLFEDIKLKNKIEKANYSQLICNSTNIFLRAGTHNLNGNMVEIETPINIIGDGYENKIIINGGLLITGNQKLGKVVIRKVTLQSSKLHGLFINSGMSVICEDVIIKDNNECGVLVQNAKCRLINVRVIGNGHSGIASYVGAEVTLSSERTESTSKWARMISLGNGTKGGEGHFGLDAGYSDGKIFTVYPLTKQEISMQNHGGGNWGGETIKRVTKDYDVHQQMLL